MSIKGFVLSGLVGIVGLVLFIPTQGCKSSTEATGERICTPGANVFCRCADRSQGTKLCADDGKSFATPCSTDESRTECAGGEIDDPNTGKTVDDDGNIIDDSPDGGPSTTNPFACPGKATALIPGTEVVLDGDTTGATDTAKGTSNCSTGGGGNDHVYKLPPTGSGRVDFTVKGEGAMNPVAYIRTKCDDETSQVRCAPPLGPGGNLVFQQNMVANTDYFLVVDGASGSAGKYKVTAKLTTMPFCGDGKVTDGEACDDINKDDNDGCDPSCKKPNGNPASGGSCPGHPVDIWSGQTVTATGSNGAAGYTNPFSSAFDSCAANTVTDHVYQLTPHANGYVTISVASSLNHTVSVRKSSCTGATTACKFKGTDVNTLVTANTPIWIAVSGEGLQNNTGDYTLTIVHTPQ
jgi:cysteine-rich repeat protein